MLLSILVLLSTNVITLIDNKEIREELESLKQQESQKVNTNKTTAFLKKIGDIKLHYNNGGYPAFGYKANINTFLAEDNKVEIIEEKENWSRVNITGWIPSWYLITNKPIEEEGYSISQPQYRTVQSDCQLYLAPNVPSANKNDAVLSTGQVVKLLYNYNDWYYVQRLVKWDANEFPEGWVKKSNLATFDQLKPSEVMIKKGTMTYEYGSDVEVGKLNRDIYGRIKEINNGWCDLSAPGAFPLRVRVEDITFEIE